MIILKKGLTFCNSLVFISCW